MKSDEGIQPLPEKLESIAKMPVPKNAKQVKQFLGLVGYYHKFIPRFADIYLGASPNSPAKTPSSIGHLNVKSVFTC